MYTAVVIPPARKRPLDLQNYAAKDWNADAAFLEKEFANKARSDAKVADRKQSRPVKKGWAVRWARSVPQHK